MSSNPFAQPASASGISWEDLNGSLLLIEPHSVEEDISTTFGDKDAVKADVAVLDGELVGEVYQDALIFPGVLISQLRSRIGQKVLGRLGQGVAKAGQKPPWKLEEADDKDTKRGIAYLSGKFAKPASRDDDEPPF